ncbi:MAG: tetratricopeptide repeat protein [bacterium]
MKKALFLILLTAWALPALAQTPAAQDGPTALYEKAKKLFDEKHYQEARNSLGQLVAEYPTESFVPQARLLLADLEENFDSATARFQMLAAEYEGSPTGAEAQKDLGDHYYLADKYAQAVQSYQDYLQQYPKSPNRAEIRYWLGSSYWAQDEDNPAREEFQKVLDDSKDSAWFSKCRVALGNIYFKENHYDQAEQQYLKVLQDDPNYNELNSVYDKLGQTFEAEKKDRQAYASYQTLLDRYPNALEAVDAQNRMKALAQVHPDYAEAAGAPSPTPEATATVTARSSATPMVSEAQTPVITPTVEVSTQPSPSVQPTATPVTPFHVQIGVFTQKVYVEKAKQSTAKLGYPAFVVTAKNDSSPYTYYKVRVGNYFTRTEAEKVAANLSRRLKQQVIVVEDQAD